MIFPYDYIPDPTRGRPLFFGKIFIGLPDTDPTIPANQKESLLIQENGSTVPAEYPILTSAGGVPTYNGSSVAISVTGSYSIAILDNQNNQVYYFANAGGDTAEFLASDLRSIMFDHGYLYDEIGVKLVTGVAGVDLDNALTMLDVNTGAVWDLPDNIPPGTVVVSLSGSTLTTNVGQFELAPAPNQSSLLDDLETGKYNSVQNRWIGNQNFNVLGKDGYPLLDAVPQTITAGLEIAAGIIALTECQQMTKVGGIINSDNNTGIIRRSYPKDPSGAITKTSQYGAIKNHLGEQVQAEVDTFGTGGVKISDDATHVHEDVDLSIATNGLKFLILADEPGICEDVSDEVSLDAITNKLLRERTWKDETLNRASGVPEVNNTPVDIEVLFTVELPLNNATSVTITIDGFDIYPAGARRATNIGGESFDYSFTVSPGETYTVVSTLGFRKWSEKSYG